MNDAQHAADMKQLMDLAAFRRFLWRSIQKSGILSPATNGSDGRDLAFAEGRRDLGFQLLSDAETALPDGARHPHSIMTLIAVLREEAEQKPKEKKRNDRYDDIRDHDDGAD